MRVMRFRGKLFVSVWLALTGWIDCGANPVNLPVLSDDQFEISLFAEAPLIRTPIGLEVDSKGRVIVIESHTHLRPEDYEGPEKDRILALTDSDGDGVADHSEVLAKGLTAAMNLALDGKDNIFVVCAKEVWALVDTDEDGIPDRSSLIVEMETENNYPHSALLGIEVGPDGWIYISRGNNGGMAYRGIGSDNSEVKGYGDGGAIWRCRLNGSQLHEFATGFWNPFDLALDHSSRLVAVDNDPDARGPNRMLHVINGGDYGYRTAFGKSGNHPLQAWNGELPGTLPYAVALGEAPSGLIDVEYLATPEDWKEGYLVSIWNENRIDRVKSRPKGASFAGETVPWIQGDADFRPVALSASKEGDLYFSDWADVAYPNHGKGRIWKVTPKNGDDFRKPLPQRVPLPPDQGTAAMNHLLKIDNPFLASPIFAATESSDPFVIHVVSLCLTKSFLRDRLNELVTSASPQQRLIALLALKRLRSQRLSSLLQTFLQDSSEEVRIAALTWAAEAGVVELLDDLHLAVSFPEVSRRLLKIYSSVTEVLDPNYQSQFQLQQGQASQIPRQSSSKRLIQLIANAKRPAQIRADALELLKLDDPVDYVQGLKTLSIAPPEILQQTAIRALGNTGVAEVEDFLWLLVESPRISEALLTECFFALSNLGVKNSERLRPWVNLDRGPGISIAILDCIRSIVDPRQRKTMIKELHHVAVSEKTLEELSPVYLDRLAFLVKRELDLEPGSLQSPLKRPDTIEGWVQLSRKLPGSSSRGERLFLSQRYACVQCHDSGNGHPALGPELSGGNSQWKAEQVVEAILFPDNDYPPQYQAWYVESSEGFFTGLQLDHKNGGAIEMILSNGKKKRFPAKDIQNYGVLKRSLMPSGLDKNFSVSEFLDLIAYLSGENQTSSEKSEEVSERSEDN